MADLADTEPVDPQQQGAPPPTAGTPGGGPAVVMAAPSVQLSDGTMTVDPITVTMSLLRAAKTTGDAVTAGGASMSPQDMKDAGAAALAFAQAVITLDPGRLVGGATPDAQAAASPPVTPKLPPVVDRNHDGQIGG